MFEVYMLVVVIGSLKTALDTTAPWYLESATYWVYGTTFLASVVLVSVLGLAVVILSRFRGSAYALPPSAGANPGTLTKAAAVAEEDMEVLLSSLEHAAGFGKRLEGAVTEVEEKVEIRAAAGAAEPIVPHKSRVRRAAVTLLGPSITAAIFCGVSAALLPGAGGFLQNFFVLNTFVVLTFAYGWGGLAAYSAGSLYVAARVT